MSELLYPLPCKVCGGFYEHRDNCISSTDTGIAEKIMFNEIALRHDEIVYRLETENKILRNILEDFTTTKECKETWVYEMQTTIRDVLNDRTNM